LGGSATARRPRRTRDLPRRLRAHQRARAPSHARARRGEKRASLLHPGGRPSHHADAVQLLRPLHPRLLVFSGKRLRRGLPRLVGGAMVLSAIRRLAQEEDGQALVLGALLMLVVALAVLSVSSLGRTLYEEIRLQNAADNTAYTLAAQQARAFNFYAYANRAQIAHYVGILQLLSADAIVLGLVSGLGTFAALLKTAASVCSGLKRPACAAVPVVGNALLALSSISEGMERVIRVAARALLRVDAWVGTVGVPLLVGANLFLFASQAAMLASTLGRLRA